MENCCYPVNVVVPHLIFRQTLIGRDGREWKLDVEIRWVALFLLVDILDPHSYAGLS